MRISQQIREVAKEDLTQAVELVASIFGSRRPFWVALDALFGETTLQDGGWGVVVGHIKVIPWSATLLRYALIYYNMAMIDISLGPDQLHILHAEEVQALLKPHMRLHVCWPYESKSTGLKEPFSLQQLCGLSLPFRHYTIHDPIQADEHLTAFLQEVFSRPTDEAVSFLHFRCDADRRERREFLKRLDASGHRDKLQLYSDESGIWASLLN